MSFVSAPVGAFQGIVDYTPSETSIDFVNFFKNNQTQAGKMAQHILSQTKSNIIAAKKSAQTNEMQIDYEIK